jgi:CzcA family heavy metal efflux pump
MWIVRLALNRPYTFIVLSLLLVLAAPLVMLRTPTDIFPTINIPVISAVWTYNGLEPQEMNDRIVSVFERSVTTTVNDVEHIESQSLNGISVTKIFFHPGANIATANAQVTAISQTQLRQLPPGITPPLILNYNASTVPILQLGLSGQGLDEQQLNDFGGNFIRTQLATVQGASIPWPYGGKARQVMVDIDSQRLIARGLSPFDVVNAISAQNVILPSGTAKIGDTEYNIVLNGSPRTVEEINDMPVKAVNGTVIYVRDVAHVRDGFAVQQNIVRQDGQRGVLLQVEKSGNASTLDIVAAVRAALPRIAASLPRELRIRPLFDQSIFVNAAIDGVIREGITAACLTALMILLFLGSWRSTLIIAISIPLSILASLTVLSLLGETINVMTLGGLALAVGILVDDATVTIENIERNLSLGKELKHAILDGAQEIAVPAFVSTLCISIVFLPMFLLQGVARYLFVPLAEAVMFAMLASYLLSRTIVPTLVFYLMRNHRHQLGDTDAKTGWAHGIHVGFVNAFDRFGEWYTGILGHCLRHRNVFLPAFLAVCLLSLSLAPFLGSNFFPDVDAGQIRLHIRTKTGMRVEDTAKTVGLVEDRIRQIIPSADLEGILDNIGLPTTGINLSYSNGGFIGSMDAEVLISLKPDHRATADYIRLLRVMLPRDFVGTGFFFQPADIVSQILNFGSSAPIDIQIVGNNLAGNAAIAGELCEKIRNVPGAVDVRVHQLFNQPRFTVAVDRTKSQLSGLTERDVANSVLVALSGSSQTTPNFWLSPKNGISYAIATQTPQSSIGSLDDLRTLTVTTAGNSHPQLLENISELKRATGPAVLSHYNIQPVVDIYANIQDRDLGGVSSDINKLIAGVRNKLPRGSMVAMRGQVATMRSSFAGLGLGVVFAIILVYLLIVINFQSWTTALIIITALPGALAGICWILFLTHTTLSVPALMGAIMSIGVATANSILMVSFANDRLAATGDGTIAAMEAGKTRLRPVIMTALAMIIGMIPMALGLGEGGEQNAPLGRAVIGGLCAATVATLFFVPTVFSLIHRKRLHPLGITDMKSAEHGND